MNVGFHMPWPSAKAENQGLCSKKKIDILKTEKSG